MTFFIILLILAGQTTVQGDLKLNLDQLVYSLPDNTLGLELTYEIPFSSLLFQKEDNRFLARYRILLEIYDKQGDILNAEVCEKKITTPEYEKTVTQDSFAREVLFFSISPSAVRAQVRVFDLLSERWATARFPIEKQNRTLLLRLLKSGQPNPTRTYGYNDTIIIVAEAKDHFFLTPAGETVGFTIKKGKRRVASAAFPLTKQNGKLQALFALPVNDSLGNPLLFSGDYIVEATRSNQSPITATTRFTVNLSFFYDDSLWAVKVDQLLYIATYEQIKKLKKTPKPQRQEAWKEFWQPKDPNPSTEINENEEEYFQRIAYCEKHFRHGDRGYRSDRARVYVTYGPPDEIESRPFDIDRPAEEIWYYYQTRQRFVFVDRFGSGEFILVNPQRW